MNVSSISSRESRNLFIRYANSFMSAPKIKENNDEETKPTKESEKSMGIETLTIFPKQVIDGKTIITA